MTSIVKLGGEAALAQRFRELAARWKAETALESSSLAMTAHPAYREIVSLGQRVVPFLLLDLQREPAHWFEALASITGEDPVPRSDWGKPTAMAKAWLAWGRNRGLMD